MIFTCTMNPSLDYYMEFDQPLKTGVRTNRSSLEYYESGGKGINVSIVLSNLGVPTRALGFVGGFTKDFYVSLLAKYEHIVPNFTYIQGHTRINVKMHAGPHTNANATGPYITHEAMENLMAKADKMDNGDYLIFAGASQDYLEDDVVKMLDKAIQNKVKVIIDSNPSLMKKVLPMKPFLVKTTPVELSELIEETVETKEEAILSAKKVREAGANNVMILFEDGTALLVCEEGSYECPILNHDQALNNVGTGDSIVAGFVMNYIRSHDALDSFKFGASCGSATAYSRGLATREKIDSFYKETEVTKID